VGILAQAGAAWARQIPTAAFAPKARKERLFIIYSFDCSISARHGNYQLCITKKSEMINNIHIKRDIFFSVNTLSPGFAGKLF
jgi:hypothetical protein